MRIKLSSLLALIIVAGLFLPNIVHGQVQNTNSSLGTVLSSTINGLSTALQHVKKGTRAYNFLNISITFLEKAQKLYNEGNYTGAEYYFKMAMNSSYAGISEAGGKLFAVPLGLNVSRDMALSFAKKLETLAQNIQNDTLKQEALDKISQAISLLNQPAVNATQAAHNLAQARQLLGNASAIIHQYSKENFGRHFAFYIMRQGKFKDKAFVESMSKLFLQMNFSYIENITTEMCYVNFTPVVLTGSIGVYNNVVYFNSSMVIPYITLGNETFVPMEIMVPQGHGHLARGHHSQKVQQSYEIIGFINSSYAVSYVSSHKGYNITVEALPFVWVPQSFNRIHSKAQELNITVLFVPQQFFNMTLFYNGSAWRVSPFLNHDFHKIPILIIVLRDVGSYSSAPQGLQVQYSEIPN
ncbi:MAG: hypothetical protein ACP5SE_03125 [Nitrososphaeria archaeon]